VGQACGGLTWQVIPANSNYGYIHSALEAAGKPIGGNDPLIAGHAYAIGATLVTNNTNEFKRLPGLKVGNGRREYAMPRVKA